VPTEPPNVAAQLFSAFDHVDENNLDVLLLDLVKQLRAIENLKVSLVENHPDFSLYDAFEAMDRAPRKGFVSQLGLLECLEDVRILGLCQYTKKTSYVSAFLNNHCREGKLRFSDFLAIFGPWNDRYLAKVVAQRPPSGFYFTGDTMLKYRELWQRILNLV
jgi:hypothetical protein